MHCSQVFLSKVHAVREEIRVLDSLAARWDLSLRVTFFRDPSSLRQDLAQRRDQLTSLLKSSYAVMGAARQLGHGEACSRLSSILGSHQCAAPSFLGRNWSYVAVASAAVVVGARIFFPSFAMLGQSVRTVVSSLQNFFVNHLTNPSMSIIRDVFFNKKTPVDTTSRDLTKASLERMLMEFEMQQLGRDPSLDSMTAAKARASAGDLTTVIKIYESEVRNPMRNIMAGELVQALLIQVAAAVLCCDLPDSKAEA